VGKLGAIAVLRTALNYFLEREMRDAEEKTENVPAQPSAEDHASA
jgi:uncharacterized membrane protein